MTHPQHPANTPPIFGNQFRAEVPNPHSIRNFQAGAGGSDGQYEKYDIEMLKQIIMTFSDNFSELKILNFDFRKYQSFFY